MKLFRSGRACLSTGHLTQAHRWTVELHEHGPAWPKYHQLASSLGMGRLQTICIPWLCLSTVPERWITSCFRHHIPQCMHFDVPMCSTFLCVLSHQPSAAPLARGSGFWDSRDTFAFSMPSFQISELLALRLLNLCLHLADVKRRDFVG